MFFLYIRINFVIRKYFFLHLDLQKRRMGEIITIDDFAKVDIRVGKILSIEDFPNARKPAYKLTIDFGEVIGLKRSSAQITSLYQKEELIGKYILALVNFPPRQIADFMSEVLVLGLTEENGSVVLIQPEREVKLGIRLS